MGKVIDAPHRLDSKLKHPAQCQSEWNGKPSAQVTFAVAACDAIYGQHHHIDTSLLGTLRHRSIESSVFVEIELINLRRVIFLAKFFQADRSERRHTKH